MSFIARLFRKRRDHKQKRKPSAWSSPKRWFSTNGGGHHQDDQDTVCYDKIDRDLLFNCIQTALCPKSGSVDVLELSQPSFRTAKTTDHLPTKTRTTHVTDKARKRWSTGMLDGFSPPTKGFQTLSTIPEIAVDSHLFSNTPSPPPPLPSLNKEILISV